MTNPFEQPAQAPQPQQPAANPYGQPHSAAAPTGNPYGQPQQVPTAAPPWLATPTPAEQQQYAPAPQYQQQYTQQAPAAASQIAFGSVQSVGVAVAAAAGATFADMYGRLLMIFPESITSEVKAVQYWTDAEKAAGSAAPQDKMTATVIVLDDGQGGMNPMPWGGQAGPPPVPHTELAQLPYVRKQMWIRGSRIIPQLRPYLPQPGQPRTPAAGRIVKAGPRSNDAWYLEQAGPAEVARCEFYLQAVAGGKVPHPLAP